MRTGQTIQTRVDHLLALLAQGECLSQEELTLLREQVQRLATLEQKHAQQAAFLQQLIDLIPLGVAVHLNGQVVMINPAGVTLLGAQNAMEILGRPAIEFVHPDSRESASQRIRTLLQTPAGADFSTVPFTEETFLTVDGKPFIAEVAGLRLAPAEVGIPILVIFRDITAQKQQRQALEESETRFRQLVRLMPDGVMIHKDRRILFINPAMQRLMRVSDPKELLGHRIDEFLLAEERFYVEQRIRNLLERWIALPISRNHIVRPDGSIFLAEVRAFPFEDRGEKAVLLVLSDVTEREQMLRQLERSEAKFRTLAELLPAIVFAVSSEDHLVYMNPWAQRFLKDLLSSDGRLDFQTIIEPHVAAKTRATFHNLQVGESAHFELPVRDHTGAYRWMDVRITKTVMDEQVVALSVAFDITWRKKMERALKEHAHRLLMALEEERRRIARDLHDEVGQQLVGMKFALERAHRYAPAGPAQDALQDALQQLADLTAQVRALSLSFRPVMLDDLGLLRTLVSHFEHYTQRTGIQVRFTQSGLNDIELPQSHALAIYRVIQEALTNVARHAQTDEVTITLDVRNNDIIIDIIDHGVGFDPQTAWQNYQSSGLRSMIERADLLSGHLEIHSAPQKGTHIHAVFPVSDTKALQTDNELP